MGFLTGKPKDGHDGGFGRKPTAKELKRHGHNESFLSGKKVSRKEAEAHARREHRKAADAEAAKKKKKADAKKKAAEKRAKKNADADNSWW